MSNDRLTPEQLDRIRVQFSGAYAVNDHNLTVIILLKHIASLEVELYALRAELEGGISR